MERVKKYEYLDETFYTSIKELLEQARKRICRHINGEMVLTYWQIGKMIVEKQGGEDRAKYGDELITELSYKLTKDFGKGYTVTNLRYMRMFYKTFKKSHALRDELSWTHYRLLLGVESEEARNFYINEAIDGNWSTRQLEREINTFSYQRYLASHGNHDVVEDVTKRELPSEPQSIIKDPYVLNFLGLKPDSAFLKNKGINNAAVIMGISAKSGTRK